MVAYSFKRRFTEPIIAGAKRQTIRAHRKRHARPGEALQLYTGMRTRQCRKILVVDPICESVAPVRLLFTRGNGELGIIVDGAELPLDKWEAFARADGFPTLLDMVVFWFANHGRDGVDQIDFNGALIKWRLGDET